jgi:DHA3 family macrolide efflux protein-like MFS transporter
MRDSSVAHTNGPRRPTRLLNRDFLLLWQGQFVSQVGNQAYVVAMMYWLMEASDSATLMGLIMMASILPGVVMGPFGGAVADRHSRKLIIVASDLMRGVSVLFVAIVMFSHPQATAGVLTILFAVSLLNGLIGATFQPAISAAIPDLVPANKVAAANSMNQFSVQTAILIGQASGGLLYRVFGAPILFVIDGVSYIVSALSESFIRIPTRESGDASDNVGSFATYRADAIYGIRYVWRRVGMRGLLLVSAAINFLAMPVIVLLPFFVSRELLKGPEWYGFLLASMGAGSLFGYLIIGTIEISPVRRPSLVIGLLLAVGVSIALLGNVNSPWIAMSVLFSVGACAGAVNIIVVSLFQVTSPTEIRGRVMSLVISLSGAVSPLGMLLGGILADAMDKNISAIYIGCGISIVLVAIFSSRHAAIHNFLVFQSVRDN